MNANALAALINADPACERDLIQARVWTSVPGKERVYLQQATGPSLKKWKDAGHIDANTGALVGVPARIANRVEPLIPTMAATLPNYASPTFHAAVRRGEAAVHGTEADLLAAVEAGYVSMDDAMNQDF